MGKPNNQTLTNQKKWLHASIAKVAPEASEKGADGSNDFIIEAYFTSDKMDVVGDIITREATVNATGAYRQFGNIRLMHQPVPVGKMVSIGEDDGLEWNQVRIRIVDEHTKMLINEGVLSALSVGIMVIKWNPIDAEGNDCEFGENMRGFKITEYKLVEISVVDHPANYDAVITDEAKHARPQYAKAFQLFTEDAATAEKTLRELLAESSDEKVAGMAKNDVAWQDFAEFAGESMTASKFAEFVALASRKEEKSMEPETKQDDEKPAEIPAVAEAPITEAPAVVAAEEPAADTKGIPTEITDALNRIEAKLDSVCAMLEKGMAANSAKTPEVPEGHGEGVATQADSAEEVADENAAKFAEMTARVAELEQKLAEITAKTARVPMAARAVMAASVAETKAPAPVKPTNPQDMRAIVERMLRQES